jgi:hypothetical protein
MLDDKSHGLIKVTLLWSQHFTLLRALSLSLLFSFFAASSVSEIHTHSHTYARSCLSETFCCRSLSEVRGKQTSHHPAPRVAFRNRHVCPRCVDGGSRVRYYVTFLFSLPIPSVYFQSGRHQCLLMLLLLLLTTTAIIVYNTADAFAISFSSGIIIIVEERSCSTLYSIAVLVSFYHFL